MDAEARNRQLAQEALEENLLGPVLQGVAAAAPLSHPEMIAERAVEIVAAAIRALSERRSH